LASAANSSSCRGTGKTGDRPQGAHLPHRASSMLVLPPDAWWHIVQGYELQGWALHGRAADDPLASTVFRRRDNPLPDAHPFQNYWRGLSPMRVAMLPASTDYASGQFMKGS